VATGRRTTSPSIERSVQLVKHHDRGSVQFSPPVPALTSTLAGGGRYSAEMRAVCEASTRGGSFTSTSICSVSSPCACRGSDVIQSSGIQLVTDLLQFVAWPIDRHRPRATTDSHPNSIRFIWLCEHYIMVCTTILHRVSADFVKKVLILCSGME
jgi:hypothetical protein